MTTQTTERAFEDTVESLLLDSGWQPGDRARWDVELALFPSQAIDFIRQTQPKQWDRVAALYGGAVDRRITEELVKELELKGTLDVLRHGFRFSGRTFKLAYFKPAHGLNPSVGGPVRQQPTHGHPPGPVPPRTKRHRGRAVRAERPPSCHLRAEEPHDRPDLERRRPPVQAGPRPQRAAVPLGQTQRWSTSPLTRTRSTWPPSSMERGRGSCHSTAAATPVLSGAARATPSTRRATPPATSGRKCSNASASSTSSAPTSSPRSARRRWKAAEGPGSKGARRSYSRATTSSIRCPSWSPQREKRGRATTT